VIGSVPGRLCPRSESGRKYLEAILFAPECDVFFVEAGAQGWLYDGRKAVVHVRLYDAGLADACVSGFSTLIAQGYNLEDLFHYLTIIFK
jgi:hypothetical protein